MSRLRLIVCLLLLALAGSAAAHSSAPVTNLSGTPIPSVSHGEMAVIADYRGRILGIAGRVRQTDPTFRTLLNYSAIQYSYCLWGVAPGAVSDEQSPFNECAHAYLSAAKALLLHMRTMPDVAEPAGALISEIDAVVVGKGAAFIGCQYSGEAFNTAAFVTPHWETCRAIHPASSPSAAC